MTRVSMQSRQKKHQWTSLPFAVWHSKNTDMPQTSTAPGRKLTCSHFLIAIHQAKKAEQIEAWVYRS
jgi:hypothetical protein